MDVSQAMTERHCKRKFLDKELPKECLHKVLQQAGHAASSKNSQPWQVAVVQGKKKDALKSLLLEKATQGIEESPDYIYMTDPTPQLFHERARALGYALFELKGIQRNDREKRRAHWLENYAFFGAPCVLFFHLHPAAEKGNFLDLGLFLQNVMLGLVSEGLGSCPQYSLTSYTQTIKEELSIPKERILVCGLSCGYSDESDPVNTFVPERLATSEYVQWYD